MPSAVNASAIRSQLTKADRISAGDSATISACARRCEPLGPAARAVASTPATAQTASSATVTSKNSRPLMASLTFRTSQAAACMAPPISTGYSTGWPV